MNGPGQGVPNRILQFANLECRVLVNERFVVSAEETECHDESYLGLRDATGCGMDTSPEGGQFVLLLDKITKDM